MKKKFKSFALILLMCGTYASAWADGGDSNYIINEGFESFPSSISAQQTEYNFWTLRSAKSVNSNYLKIEPYNSSNKKYGGYAKTPSFNYTGDVQLSFNFLRVTANSIILTVSIENGGYFENDDNNNGLNSKDFSLSTSVDVLAYRNRTVKIIGTTNNTKVLFSLTNKIESVGIDDVKIIKLGDLTLDETIDSREPIEANNGTECVVHTIRTLTGGIWNTLCLPFDVDMDLLGNVLGANQNIQLRTYTGYADKVMTFEPATSVAAGTPFLIKLNTTVVNPAFTNVTIVNTPAQSVTNNGVSFVGTYGPVDLKTDGSELFITKSSNMLSVPAAASKRMYGMRAFIRASGGIFPARIVVGDDETTDLSTAMVAAEQDKTTYDLNGRQVMHPKKGLYIVNNKITFLK